MFVSNRREEKIMPTVEQIWEMVKKLSFEDRVKLARRALNERVDEAGDSKRKAAVDAFLNGPVYRWNKTERDEWHAR